AEGATRDARAEARRDPRSARHRPGRAQGLPQFLRSRRAPDDGLIRGSGRLHHAHTQSRLMPAQGLVGVAALLLLAWLLSEDRKGALAGAQRRLLLAGLLLLFGLALLLLKVPPVRDALLSLNAV